MTRGENEFERTRAENDDVVGRVVTRDELLAEGNEMLHHLDAIGEEEEEEGTPAVDNWLDDVEGPVDASGVKMMEIGQMGPTRPPEGPLKPLHLFIHERTCLGDFAPLSDQEMNFLRKLLPDCRNWEDVLFEEQLQFVLRQDWEDLEEFNYYDPRMFG